MQPPTESKSAEHHLPLREVGILLLKHFGHHKGLFDVSVEFGFTGGGFDFPPHGRKPGAVLGVMSVGVVPVNVANPETLDAAVENPARKVPTARAKKASQTA